MGIADQKPQGGGISLNRIRVKINREDFESGSLIEAANVNFRN